MAVKAKSKKFEVKRVADVEFLSAKEVADTIASRGDFALEDVFIDDKAFEIEIIDSLDELKLAENLHQQLLKIRAQSPGLLRDHGFWSWLALYPLRDYVVNRWCDGFDNGLPRKTSGCTHFLSGDGVHAQARCASRRLFIAADTSKRAEGDYSQIGLILNTADKFSTVFERKLGLDVDLAIELFQQFEVTRADRKTYRMATKLLGLILATVCLEDLDRERKKQLVSDALQEVSKSLIDGD